MHTLQHVANTNIPWSSQELLQLRTWHVSWNSLHSPVHHTLNKTYHLHIFLIIWNRYKGSNLSQMQALSPNSLSTLTKLARNRSKDTHYICSFSQHSLLIRKGKKKHSPMWKPYPNTSIYHALYVNYYHITDIFSISMYWSSSCKPSTVV